MAVARWLIKNAMLLKENVISMLSAQNANEFAKKGKFYFCYNLKKLKVYIILNSKTIYIRYVLIFFLQNKIFFN